jgi:hypothetical protein
MPCHVLPADWRVGSPRNNGLELLETVETVPAVGKKMWPDISPTSGEPFSAIFALIRLSAYASDDPAQLVELRAQNAHDLAND